MIKNNIEKIIFVVLLIVCLLGLIFFSYTEVKNAYSTINGLQIEKSLLEVDRNLYQKRCENYEIQIISLKDDLNKAKEMLKENNYIGEFEITYYTAGPESTGKSPGHYEYGITKSGELVKKNYTIAADWSVLPKNTKVYIENVGVRVVKDTGGLIKGQNIDVYVENLEDIPSVGRHKEKVYVIEWGEG